MQPFIQQQVQVKFEAYPALPRRRLLALRELIFETAKNTSGVGELEESLKWGEPAYAGNNKAGTTIRIDWKEKDPRNYAMYVHCQTSLIAMFRTMFPHDFSFQGNRALILKLSDEPPEDALTICIAAALTYHVKK